MAYKQRRKQHVVCVVETNFLDPDFVLSAVSCESWLPFKHILSRSSTLPRGELFEHDAKNEDPKLAAEISRGENDEK